ncbi:rhodanese domain-containing protein CG4456-like [Armigeres subalbatus]|uniref:rhodanese domain-containing protein CG4456-like n=1 Tax=Armigeres subalbatus TaxID=124917 RepID=UPI002ED3C28B
MASCKLVSLVVLLVVIAHSCLGEEESCLENKFFKGCIEDKFKATFEEIIDLKFKFNILLIDVRQPEELNCTGWIPNSINIPLASISFDLQLTANKFLCIYGRKKPTFDDLVIFYCNSGNRSAKAALLALQLGFKNVKNYVGSWIEYAKHFGLPLGCTGWTPAPDLRYSGHPEDAPSRTNPRARRHATSSLTNRNIRNNINIKQRGSPFKLWHDTAHIESH